MATPTQLPASDAPLVLTDLTHRFVSSTGSNQVLTGVSAQFPERSWTAIMGPSGSGKSTLLQCAAGLLRASEGEVNVAGTSLTELSDAEATVMRRDRIGFIFQSFNLVPSLTASQNVELPLRLAGHRPKRNIAIDALAEVGLIGDEHGRRPAELSGGQQQRVAIARALVNRPLLIFADEPTGSLDSHTSADVLDQFEGMKSVGSTIIMVTHDPAVAARADRTLFLFDGRIVDERTRSSSEEIATRLASLELKRSA